MLNLKKFNFLLVLLLFAEGRVMCAGGAAASFLKIDLGARPVAMGGAFTGLADDVDAVYWNPAGLVNVKHLQQTFTHIKWLEEINVEHIALATRLTPLSSIGVGIEYVGMGDIKRVDKSGNDAGYYSASDLAQTFSYARILKENIFVGGTFKMISEKIENESAGAFGLDAGVLYKRKKITYGFAVKNLGTGLTFLKTPASLPLGLRLGASYSPRKQLMLVSDINMPFDDTLSIHIGGEYYGRKKGIDYALRAGINTSSLGYMGALSALSLGFGAYFDKFELDYAFSPRGIFGLTHFITFKMKFDFQIEDNTWKNKTRLRGNTDDVYREAMRWFNEKIKEEHLTLAEQITILARIIKEFKRQGADVSSAEKKLRDLKNASR